MTIGPPKPSPAQLRRRRLKVAEHANAGYNVAQSAKSLGVATGTVGNDRMVMRKYITTPRHTRYDPSKPDPEPYDWVSDPAPRLDEPAYRLSSPVAAVASFLERMRNENGLSQTAHAVREAVEAGDAAWYVQSQATLADFISLLQQMQQVVVDGDARRKAMTLASRDDLRTSRRAHPGVKAQDMPAQGSGELPVKVYAELWRRWHAGIPLDSTTCEEISKNQNIPLARVQQAAGQFLVRYPELLGVPVAGVDAEAVSGDRHTESGADAGPLSPAI